MYGSCLNLFNLVICLVGAALFAKTSVAIFVVVIVCTISVIVSFVTRYDLDIIVPHENSIFNHTLHNTTLFTGLSFETFYDNLKPHFTIDYSTNKQTNFAMIFGVLFSGVTGIMAGANISGELKG